MERRRLGVAERRRDAPNVGLRVSVEEVADALIERQPVELQNLLRYVVRRQRKVFVSNGSAVWKEKSEKKILLAF